MRATILMLALLLASPAHALDMERLLDAVLRAEGNPNYGLLSMASCVEEPGMCRYLAREVLSIHLSRCRGEADKVACISKRWAPVGCDTDNGTNQFWERNVKWFLAKSNTNS